MWVKWQTQKPKHLSPLKTVLPFLMWMAHSWTKGPRFTLIDWISCIAYCTTQPTKRPKIFVILRLKPKRPFKRVSDSPITAQVNLKCTWVSLKGWQTRLLPNTYWILPKHPTPITRISNTAKRFSYRWWKSWATLKPTTSQSLRSRAPIVQSSEV